MDTIRRTVRRAGRPIDLKPKEYALLEFLMRHSDRPVTRSLIIEHVWDIHFDSISNVVEVHINSLRSKIDRGFAGAAHSHGARRGLHAHRQPRHDAAPSRRRLILFCTATFALLLTVLERRVVPAPGAAARRRRHVPISPS